MIAVKGGKTDLTDNLLRGGCDVDLQENVSPPVHLLSALYHCVLIKWLFVQSMNLHFKVQLEKVESEDKEKKEMRFKFKAS